MLTFNQFVDLQHRYIAAKYGISLVETERECPAHIYAADWEDYILREFNAGEDMPTRLWRALPERLQRRVLLSHRALRDDAVALGCRHTATRRM